MHAALHAHTFTLTLLLTLPVPPHKRPLYEQADHDGNTALHYASANGHLECARVLLQFGANAGASNAFGWTPIDYSRTVQAEVSLRGLVAEAERERRSGWGGGIRVVDGAGEG